ncbi:hypothetical protein [Ornithinimicrobium pratense]|uniref:Type II secretion system protein GspF domain-containing protein n=1 Tax=Ornithinimicrobium pratense TaxID=2593973 RepID=A0A5J6V2T9_9MICO|nr:hypothetical protein [Ornithinimicrobium pratense]QFG67596.1 hypothetical protein FY030_01610 [Ornithinimicrobium pratense]
MTPLLVALATAAVVLLWLPPPPTAWTPAAERESRLMWPGRHPGRARRRGRRQQVGSTQALIPEALELLALALQGGGALGEAARTVSLVLPEDNGEGLAQVASALHRGQDTGQAWAAAGPQWEPARRSLELARVAGVAPGPALRQTAADLRAGMVTTVEVGTARLGVRMVLPLGLAFLPAFVLTTVLPLVLALTRDLSW